MFDEDKHQILIAACIRCGVVFPSNPKTVLTVWINLVTLCPIRPDGTHIERGEPGTSAEPVCDTCAQYLSAVGTGPVRELFPLARFDRITIPGVTA